MNDFRKMMKIDYYDLSLRLIGLYLHPMDANIRVFYETTKFLEEILLLALISPRLTYIINTASLLYYK